jgi:hypothetical protein
MEHALPTDGSTLYGLIGIAIGCGTMLVLGWKFINEYFKDKKDNNQAFVERVVASTVTTILADFKADFHQFREATNIMQKEFNLTVLNIYKEMKK